MSRILESKVSTRYEERNIGKTSDPILSFTCQMEMQQFAKTQVMKNCLMIPVILSSVTWCEYNVEINKTKLSCKGISYINDRNVNDSVLAYMFGIGFIKSRISRSSHPEVFCKKSVLRNFAKVTAKHLCQSLFFNKVACKFIKKDTLLQVLSCEFFEIF